MHISTTEPNTLYTLNDENLSQRNNYA